MSRRACVFIIVFLYGECSGNTWTSNATSHFGYGSIKPVNTGSPPVYWDWRLQNMVSPIKNQLNCNACWAFSVVASIESHIAIHNGERFVLSEQFLIDCEKSNEGCKSASLLQIFGNIVSNIGGVLLNEDYCKYSAAKMACRWKGNPRPIPVVGFKRVPRDEKEMVKYLYKFGPLAAGINPASMAKYKGGIDQPSDEECSANKDQMTHAILIVGYSVYLSEDGKKSIPYWIIKNSWGEEWGDKGFYYLERGRNACGIASDVSFPFVQ